MNFNRPIPADEPAEQATLGAILLDNAGLAYAAPLLSAAAFHAPRHGLIYDALLALDRRREPLTAATVCSELLRTGHLDDAGGPAYLDTIRAACENPAHVESYARAVAATAVRRAAIQAAGRVIDQALDGAIEPPALQAGALAAFTDLPTQAGDGWVSAADLAIRVVEGIDDPTTRTVIPTPWPRLNAEIGGGWRENTLIVLAGVTSAGKSALALNAALGAAQAGFAVGVISLETDADSIGRRLLAQTAQVDTRRLYAGGVALRTWDRQALQTGLSALMECPRLFVRDVPLVNVDTVRLEALRLAADPRRGLDLLIVDYLQLLDGHGESGQEEIRDIVRRLKLLQMELHRPVLALSQFNNAVLGAAEPELQHLLGSGGIGQSANVVLFLHRPDPRQHPECFDLILRKNTNAVANIKIALEWNGPHQRFVEAPVAGAWEEYDAS